MTRNDELIVDGLVSLDEAMKFLSISRPTLNRLLDRGVLPTVRLVTTRRIPRRALLDLAALPGQPRDPAVVPRRIAHHRAHMQQIAAPVPLPAVGFAQADLPAHLLDQALDPIKLLGRHL